MKVSEAERRQIIAALRAGESQNATARRFGRGPSTIGRIARSEGIDPAYTAPQKANAARRDYAQAERLALLNEGFDKAREMLPAATAMHELQQWFTAVAIGIDKRRLEDGEATDRTETYDGRAIDEEINARITAIASRRRS